MFRVKQAQMTALEAYFDEEFVEQMTDTLLRSFPADCEARGNAAVPDFVRESVGRARALKATQESDLSRYVITEFIVGTEAMPEMLSEQRQQILKQYGDVDPSILIFRTYQAMFARWKDEGPPPPPDAEYEVIA